jgi:hypothetical protein
VLLTTTACEIANIEQTSDVRSWEKQSTTQTKREPLTLLVKSSTTQTEMSLACL